ncbi:MAG: Y4bD/Y4pK family protein [Actinobacteria bacterium]|nr:Y4bD/Y4pK family protein [Actinomycetota bacterium]
MSEVTVTRARHPLEGRRLLVIGAMRRLGRDELLVVLPDGSKTLMAAAWTDRDTTTANEGQALDQPTAILAPPAQLLHACELVGGLRARADAGRGQAARKPPCEEEDRAACAAEFDARTDPGATTGSDRVAARGGGGRGDQDFSSTDRPRRRDDDHRGRR